MRDSLNNSTSPFCWVRRLENSRSNEHTIYSQLHHQRSIGRRSNSTGGKVHHWQAFQLFRLFDEVDRNPMLLLLLRWKIAQFRIRQLQKGARVYHPSRTFAKQYSSSSSIVSRCLIAPMTVRACLTASTTSPVPASPLVRIIAAPSATRRRASPKFRHPHTNGTLNLCLLI